MTALDARSARTRYLVLVGLRWLPTGLLIPVIVLLALSRGLSLTEIGFVFALQGLVVLFLELPTGGLTDALGRRPVLILASLIAVLSMSLLYVADSVALFAVAMILQGVFRALDSGPLEAWYVDATLAADPSAEIEHGLSAGSTVLSLAIAVGALLSGALVALDPVEAIPALALPLLVAIGLAVL
ncbi:MAG: MFS transporter, partial [Chloroflexota bacterium]